MDRYARTVSAGADPARRGGGEGGLYPGPSREETGGESPCPRCVRRPRQRGPSGRKYAYCRECLADYRLERALVSAGEVAQPARRQSLISQARTFEEARVKARQQKIAEGGWPPRIHTVVPQDCVDYGDGEDVIEFLEEYGRITKDSVAGPSGEMLDPRYWQRRVIKEIFARDVSTGRLLHRTAMVSMGRKNGKTGMMAPVALYGLVLGGDGAEVYSAAADRPQAKLMLDAAKKTVEMVPELKSRLKTYRDAIEDPMTGSVYKALSADAYTKEGLSPTLVLADELHAWPNRDLYDVLSLAMGGRIDGLMLIVTTAGVMLDSRGQDTIAYEMFKYGQRVAAGEIEDPTFYMAWWAAKQGADVMDEQAWADANPGLGDILDVEELRAQARRAKIGGLKETQFRIKRLNTWVASATMALPAGLFEAQSIQHRVRQVKDNEAISDVAKTDLIAKIVSIGMKSKDDPRVLFFDGSFNHDCTALVAVYLDGFIEVVACWEKPGDDDDWRVPMGEVENVLYAYCGANEVLEVACDPFRWAKQIEDWGANGIPVVEFPTTSPARMVPAWAAFYDALVDGDKIFTDGDPRLERHVRNMVLKIDRLGPRPVKEHKGSGHSIDLGICAVGGYVRAMWHAANTEKLEPLMAVGS